MLFTRSHIVLFVLNVLLAYIYLTPGTFKVFWERGTCQEASDALEPLDPREWTLGDLREFDGVKSKRILLAIDWRVFDVSKSRNLYGPGTN
jgi:membrane-associated progesterone receptor component